MICVPPKTLLQFLFSTSLALCLFRIVLGVTRLLRSLRLCALRSHSQSLRSLRLCAWRSHPQSLRSLELRAHKNFQKKISLSQSTRKALKRIEIQKNFFYPFDSKRERRSATLPTPCHSQGPKECPCQVSCRLVQNCGR